MGAERFDGFFQEVKGEGDDEQEDTGTDEELTDEQKRQKELDKKYWLQDIINIARELGISKKELMEEYYPAETYAIFKRQSVINKRREAESKKPPEEKVEEVYWDQMGI